MSVIPKGIISKNIALWQPETKVCFTAKPSKINRLYGKAPALCSYRDIGGEISLLINGLDNHERELMSGHMKGTFMHNSQEVTSFVEGENNIGEDFISMTFSDKSQVTVLFQTPEPVISEEFYCLGVNESKTEKIEADPLNPGAFIYGVSNFNNVACPADSTMRCYIFTKKCSGVIISRKVIVEFNKIAK
jgi:hypothetical protein